MYELSWAYEAGAIFAMDTSTGRIIDANPSAEALMGYTRDELIGMHQSMLHPEAEREASRAEFRKAAEQPSPHSGFHLQRKDGVCLPVMAWSSKSIAFEGRSVVIIVCHDITELAEKEDLLSTQNWALGAYGMAALALGRVQTSESLLLRSICEAITHESIYVLAWVGVAEEGPGKPIRIVASAGSAAKYLDGIQMSWSENDPLGHGPSGTCLRENKTQISQDLEKMAAFAPWRESATRFGIRSSLALPINASEVWNGVLTVYSERTEAFDAPAVEVFQSLCSHITHGVQALHQKQLLASEQLNLAESRKHVVDVMSATVTAMVTAIGVRDPHTAEHGHRVAAIAVAIGREIGWDENRLHGMRLAALVHDIGNIAIPSETLTKSTRLSPAEYMLVKEHPETGYQILKDIPFASPVAAIVRQHHERLDGSGYPLGIKEDQILLEARVLAVADMVEAMASDRPYRRAWGLEYALRQIQSEAGTLLDAEVVRICSALFREKRLVIPGLDWI